MDFARSHMESHGWSEGKGLGKSESGRAQAVKVKLKFDKSGIGESGNSEHTFNWWDHAFNRASSNIEVCDDSSDDEVVVRSKSETHKGLLSTRPPKKAAQAVFYGGFVKAATKADELSEEKSRDFSSKPMTDEEILKACGGRTGHKAARHGSKMKGKLTRMKTADEILKQTLPGDITQKTDAVCITSIISDSDSDDEMPAQRTSSSDPSSKKAKKDKSKKRGSSKKQSGKSEKKAFKSEKKISKSEKKESESGKETSSRKSASDAKDPESKKKKRKRSGSEAAATSTGGGDDGETNTAQLKPKKSEKSKKSKKPKKSKSKSALKSTENPSESRKNSARDGKKKSKKESKKKSKK